MPDIPRPGEVVVITGCSGGGKSTLLAALAARGHPTLPEAGRRIVRREQATGGTALPWSDPAGFAAKTFALAAGDILRAASDCVTFVDRSPIDTIAALTVLGLPLPDLPALPLARRVFVAPPWPEIFTRDAERQHDLDRAIREYDALLPIYRQHGHDLVFLPKTTVADRVAFVEQRLTH